MQDRRGAHAHPFDARGRAVVQVEGKGRLVPHPARQGGPGAVLVARGDIDEGRRARSAVEVLVGAAHREVGVAGRKPHRKGPGGMGQIPHGQDAQFLRAGGQGRHVVPPPGAIVHLGHQQHGDAVVQGGGQSLGFGQL